MNYINKGKRDILIFPNFEDTYKIENILDQLIDILYSIYCSDEQQIMNAIVVQLVVRHLAKVEVAGSSPVCRS